MRVLLYLREKATIGPGPPDALAVSHDQIAGHAVEHCALPVHHNADDEIESRLAGQVVDGRANGVIAPSDDVRPIDVCAYPVHLAVGDLAAATGDQDLAPARKAADVDRHDATNAHDQVRLGHLAVDPDLDPLLGCAHVLEGRQVVPLVVVHRVAGIDVRAHLVRHLALGHGAMCAQGHHEYDLAIRHPASVQFRQHGWDDLVSWRGARDVVTDDQHRGNAPRQVAQARCADGQRQRALDDVPLIRAHIPLWLTIDAHEVGLGNVYA
jgi:hypothetical protein